MYLKFASSTLLTFIPLVTFSGHCPNIGLQLCLLIIKKINPNQSSLFGSLFQNKSFRVKEIEQDAIKYYYGHFFEHVTVFALLIVHISVSRQTKPLSTPSVKNNYGSPNYVRLKYFPSLLGKTNFFLIIVFGLR